MFNYINIEQYAQKVKQNFIFSKLFLSIFVVFYLIFCIFSSIFILFLALHPFFSGDSPSEMISLEWGLFFARPPRQNCNSPAKPVKGTPRFTAGRFFCGKAKKGGKPGGP